MTADLFEDIAPTTGPVEEAGGNGPLLSGWFSQGQIRLAELSVYNWGSFDGLHTASIDPEGTLITGDNGAGKSTLIDGLMALLLPAGKASFNVAAAQGDRADRSLLSYMRGSFGSAHDGASTRVKNKREKGVVTGLRAFYCADDGSCLTLAALFWTTTATNALSDVKRVYVVAKRNLKLKELLDAFGEGNARRLKQWLRDDPTLTDCDNNFSDYQELYRKLLHMDNKNAPALLSRALGLKKIDDLTSLIRELVLEPSSVKEDARKVVEEFSDLVAIHDKLIDAKEQYAHLGRLPELARAITEASQKLDSLQQEKSHLATYFGEALALLWAEQLADIDQALESISREISAIEVAERDAQASAERRHEEYLNLGGDKIEALKKDIQYAKDKLESVTRQSSRYQRDCSSLGLNAAIDEQTFLDNMKLAEGQSENIEQLKDQALESFAEIRGELSRIESELKDIDNDIREIEARPNSNIHKDYQQLRDQLVESLSLPADDLVFIGELIDVKEEERSWQGAIERALGGLKLTLLVPQKSYSMVTSWLNVRHTGLHVRVQVVLEKQKDYVEFSEKGFLRKLVWKDHPYRDWLKKHLSKYDLQCVSGTKELDVTPFSMTREGLVHKEKGRFEKKDQTRIDNRRDWYLGFSNKSRLAILYQDKKQLEQTRIDLKAKDKHSLEELKRLSDQEKLWERLITYTWDQINVPYWKQRVEAVQADLAELEKAGGDLDKARNRWEAAKEHLQEIQNRKGQMLTKKGSLDNDKSHAQVRLDHYQKLAAVGMSDEVRRLLQARVGKVKLDDANRQADFEKDIESQLEKTRSDKSKAENVANGIMGSFRGKDKWQPITVDWPTGLEGLNYYLEHFHYIETEGLPELIEQFKERLNKHATQSLARIKTRLESEREDILERIETINQVLKRTEFKQGSYLRLGSKREKYPHVLEFERKINSALSQATSDDHEARFQILSDVVEILEKASAPGTSTNMESLRLLDPRYQMSFYAEERDAQTGEVRDVLESSSGKSGGEKESFAGTIVAASLAYVLTPDGADRPVYCTVFLDEAFSNTAESVSRRVLRVFKELNIHVNLITPYKNLNLARESARSLLIAERNRELHESHLCEVTWEEIDQRMAQQDSNLLKQVAEHQVELTTLENQDTRV